jgi:hypothetical protein
MLKPPIEIEAASGEEVSTEDRKIGKIGVRYKSKGLSDVTQPTKRMPRF